MAQAVVAPVGAATACAFIPNKGQPIFPVGKARQHPLGRLAPTFHENPTPHQTNGTGWRLVAPPGRPMAANFPEASQTGNIRCPPLVCRFASMHALRSVTCDHVVRPTNKPVCENAQTGLSIHINALLKVDKPEHRAYVPWPYANNSFTLAEMALPSARPASFLEARPITLPISLALVAPTSAMMARSSASNSSGVRALGR